MIRVGTRSSRLALAQASEVVEGLQAQAVPIEIVTLETLGDRNRTTPVHELGVAGAFTSGLERHLHAGEIDLAVHSLKDLPIEEAHGLEVAAILPRGSPGDMLLVSPEAHDPEQKLPLFERARVATSGPRRQSQLLAARPDLSIVNVRGNVDTRVDKLRAGWFDALVTARVALDRMDLDTSPLRVCDLEPEDYPPAPGQAAIAVQARAGSKPARIAARLEDPQTRRAVDAERKLLGHLGGGCGLPVGAWIRKAGDRWSLDATFAGHGWTPASRPRVKRIHREGSTPSELLNEAQRSLVDGQAQPRRPELSDVDKPSGEPGLVVASEPTARSWAALLQTQGQPALPAATQAVEPTDPTPAARRRLDQADWVAVTSRQAAAPLAEASRGEPLDAYVGAVGHASARALQRQGLPAHVVAPEATGKSLAREIARLAEAGARVLLAQGDTVHGGLREGLVDEALDVDPWVAYRTQRTPLQADDLDVDLPAPFALVMSPRNAQIMAESASEPIAHRYVAIGSSTAAALEDLGLPAEVAPAPSPQAVLEVIP